MNPRVVLLLFCIPVSLVAAEPAKVHERPIAAEDRRHWAFQPPRAVQLPPVRNLSWIQAPIDRFILARLEQAGLQPSPAVHRAAWLRRVTFDLIGLPPTPEELDQFLQDERPGAFERVVDRLLASPHYGECWAQHWLDVVRYADTNGYEIDGERPHAWRYRDYVVRALNEDKPYDRFLTEQLAGDELAVGQRPERAADLLTATGFNRCGPIHLVAGNTDPEENRQEVLTEMTGAVGSAFLGLTMGCARCHDHKFDPISQADYYRLQGFFAAAQPREVDIAPADEKTAYDRRAKEVKARIAPLQKKVADLDRPYKDLLTQIKKALLDKKYQDALEVDQAKRTAEQKKLVEEANTLLKVTWDEILDAMTPQERVQRADWRKQIHELEAQLPPPPAQAWTIQNDVRIPPTFVLKRGEYKRKGAEVQPAFPRILVNGSAPASPERLTRTALARWLTRPDHPLTARVMVNRIWQHHFGRGLTPTPNDFGQRGQRPSHPELLDWLTGEFVQHGWSLKHLHRLMVLSGTYRQSSRVNNPDGVRADPDNRLLWRMNRRRLQGEELRDAFLAVSGGLNPKMAGPPVRTPLEPEVYELIFTEGEPDGLWHVSPDPREHQRRSLYLFVKRNVRLPMLEAFDQPDSLRSCPVRLVSTFAPQALILLNGPLAQELSRRFAARLVEECGADANRLVERAFRLALARQPTAAEQDLGREFVAAQTRLLEQTPAGKDGPTKEVLLAAVADFCLAVFNRNEFLYVD